MHAAMLGNHAVVGWLRVNGCPWNADTCAFAAAGGHLELLQWAHTNGCQWDEDTCMGAVRYGHLELLRWAPANLGQFDTRCGGGTRVRRECVVTLSGLNETTRNRQRHKINTDKRDCKRHTRLSIIITSVLNNNTLTLPLKDSARPFSANPALPVTRPALLGSP